MDYFNKDKFNQLIHEANLVLESINVDNNDKVKIIELIDKLFNEYESRLCSNCRYFIPYEKVIELHGEDNVPQIAKLNHFGFCNALGLYVDQYFGCNGFEKDNDDNNANSNTD